MKKEHRILHRRFVGALQGTSLTCDTKGCAGPVETTDLSQTSARVKTFEVRCLRCGWHSRLAGVEDVTPPWDGASLLAMANEHLMHQQASCPHDNTPVVFTSLPNPRRRARYRISCYYCGRQAEMDWPPPETRG